MRWGPILLSGPIFLNGFVKPWAKDKGGFRKPKPPYLFPYNVMSGRGMRKFWGFGCSCRFEMGDEYFQGNRKWMVRK